MGVHIDRLECAWVHERHHMEMLSSVSLGVADQQMMIQDKMTDLVFETDLRDARLVLLLLEENSSPVGQKGHVGVVQLNGLAVRFQRLCEALIENN